MILWFSKIGPQEHTPVMHTQSRMTETVIIACYVV